MISATEALERLRAGNGRFVANHPEFQAHTGVNQRTELAMGQSPFAVILGCSDSRVPVEIIFDQGLGELFVIRVAGNIIGETVIGSIEFAAAQLGTRLVVVLGHSQCGAVSAAFDAHEHGEEDLSPSLRSIVNRILPSVHAVPDSQAPREAQLDLAVRQNVRTSVERLRHGSAIVENAISNEGLRVVGANYDLLTGVVDFFDGVPLE